MNYSPDDIQRNKRESGRALGSMITAATGLENVGAKEAKQCLEEASQYYARLQSLGINIAI